MMNAISYLENKKAGVSLNGHSGQKTSFSGGSIIVKQNGHATLTIDLPDGTKETYLITLRECSLALTIVPECQN
jgi:hypothetical protein